MGFNLPQGPIIPILSIRPKDVSFLGMYTETFAYPCTLLLYSQQSEIGNNLDACQHMKGKKEKQNKKTWYIPTYGSTRVISCFRA